MSADRSGAAVARLNAGLVVAGMLALASLVLEHGVGVGASATRVLWLVDLGCVLAFALLQAAKLATVPHPRRYLATHKIDFSMLFVLAVAALAHMGLRGTPEYRYLASRGYPSPLWAFYVGVLQVYLLVIVGLRSTLLHRLFEAMRLRPAQMLVVSFLILVTLGATLLALPGATRAPGAMPAVDALFTATSAVCVTGLVVRDTGTEFTSFGLVVILGLIQAGGLGMLTLTGALVVFSGRRIARGETEKLAQALDVEDLHAMRRTIAQALLATLLIEAGGALLLFRHWESTLADPFRRASWAGFHAVSAFCNAGFALFPRQASLTPFMSDGATLGVVGLLIVLGGLGFRTLDELGRSFVAAIARRRQAPLSLQSRVVLWSSAALIVLGGVGLVIAETGGILRGQSAPVRWLSALFQSVSLRTAGFNSVELVGMGVPAIALCCALMMAGGSPGGTAGGMKTTTVVAAILRPLRRGAIDPALGRQALRLTGAYLLTFLLLAAIVALLQREWSGRVAFEVASALGTVGLSLGLTPELTVPARLVVCVAMFVGRVGPFALAAALVGQRTDGRRPGRLQIG